MVFYTRPLSLSHLPQPSAICCAPHYLLSSIASDGLTYHHSCTWMNSVHSTCPNSWKSSLVRFLSHLGRWLDYRSFLAFSSHSYFSVRQLTQGWRLTYFYGFQSFGHILNLWYHRNWSVSYASQARYYCHIFWVRFHAYWLFGTFYEALRLIRRSTSESPSNRFASGQKTLIANWVTFSLPIHSFSFATMIAWSDNCVALPLKSDRALFSASGALLIATKADHRLSSARSE